MYSQNYKYNLVLFVKCVGSWNNIVMVNVVMSHVNMVNVLCGQI